MKPIKRTVLFKMGAVIYLVETNCLTRDEAVIEAKEKMSQKGINADKLTAAIMNGGYNTTEHL